MAGSLAGLDTAMGEVLVLPPPAARAGEHPQSPSHLDESLGPLLRRLPPVGISEEDGEDDRGLQPVCGALGPGAGIGSGAR